MITAGMTHQQIADRHGRCRSAVGKWLMFYQIERKRVAPEPVWPDDSELVERLRTETYTEIAESMGRGKYALWEHLSRCGLIGCSAPGPTKAKIKRVSQRVPQPRTANVADPMLAWLMVPMTNRPCWVSRA
jgi:hypothetical protein